MILAATRKQIKFKMLVKDLGIYCIHDAVSMFTV